jgi:hypothetical protein
VVVSPEQQQQQQLASLKHQQLCLKQQLQHMSTCRTSYSWSGNQLQLPISRPHAARQTKALLQEKRQQSCSGRVTAAAIAALQPAMQFGMHPPMLPSWFRLQVAAVRLLAHVPHLWAVQSIVWDWNARGQASRCCRRGLPRSRGLRQSTQLGPSVKVYCKCSRAAWVSKPAQQLTGWHRQAHSSSSSGGGGRSLRARLVQA